VKNSQLGNRAAPRGRIVATVAAAFGALALFSANSQAVKYFDSFFGGTSGTPALGGLFGSTNGGVGDTAVNEPSIATDGTAHSGWIYVVDRGNNRIQAFDANRNFQFAIGRDVVQSGGTGDTSERQTVTVAGAPSGGTFTLTFGANTTAPIAFNAPSSGAGSVDEALEAIASVGAGNANVTGPAGGPYAVEFTGARASVDQAQMTANGAGLTPVGTVTVATTQDGASFEKCTIAAQCKAGLQTTTAATARGNAGTFNVATGIDVDQASGHFFVGERNANRRLSQFTASGDFVRAFGWEVTASGPGNTGGFETCNAAASDVCQLSAAAGTATGQFGSYTSNDLKGVAVAPPGAPNAGTVYAADPANRRVLPFNVPSNPTGLVAPGPAFGAIAQFPQSNWPKDIAADSNGIVYASLVSDTGSAPGVNGQVARYDTSASAFQLAISPASDDDFFGRSTLASLEIDHATDHLFAGRAPSASNTGFNTTGIVELDVSANPSDIDVTHLVDVHGVGLGLVSTSSPQALGIGAGRLVLSVSAAAPGTGTGQRVVLLDDSGIDPPPTTTLQPPSSVGCTTATLNAQINPNGPTGFPTSYRFELSKDGVTWDAATADQSVGDGGAPVTVDDSVAGLEANTLYRVRIVTTRTPAAGEVASPELNFLTDPCPPVVETVGSQHVGDTTAQLVGRLNPGGLETAYWFEWGDTGYGNQVPVPAASGGAGGETEVVTETLTGLEPESVYHFRLCAQNTLASEKVCGADRVFTTRAAGTATAERAYEMVTSPDKVLRRGGSGGDPALDIDYSRMLQGLASPSGESLFWAIYAGVSDPDAGAGFSGDFVYEVRNREDRDGVEGADGWYGDAAIKIAPPTGVNGAINDFIGVSADLATQTWNVRYSLFTTSAGETGSEGSVHVMGDDGGPRDAGWYPWLDTPWYSGSILQAGGFDAIVDDEGERLVGWSAESRDIVPADGSLTPSQLTPSQSTGRALFLATPALDWRPQDLVNECTGAGADATVIPTRDDQGTLGGPSGSFSLFATYGSGATELTIDLNQGGPPVVGHSVSGAGIPAGATVVAVGASSFTISVPTTAAGSFAQVTGGQIVANFADDTIEGRSCAAGSPTSVRGASLGSDGAVARLEGSSAAAISDAGDRMFFLSPDPAAGASAPGSCPSSDVATGAGTDCPPQLFVRQYDDNGDAVVRWLSRAEDALFEAPQRIGAFGNGVSFEGASRDGSVAYFRTNAPLTVDDPNGGSDPIAGTASRNSWDLYRYELGSSNDVDPASGDPGDRLTRVSGGPTNAVGSADVTAGSSSVGNVTATSGAFVAGQVVAGDGIPLGTTVESVGSGTLTLSASATASGAAVDIRASGDPNTNCAVLATSGADSGGCSGALNSATPNGAGAAVRFMSDSGDRVYFVTAARIPGADNSPPQDGVSAPTNASSQVNAATRNLYLYDAGKAGAAAYKFIATIPYAATSSSDLAKCASSDLSGGSSARAYDRGRLSQLRADTGPGGSCVHGTSSGDAVVFESAARLTDDDVDSAADVYLYDASVDELVRISAPPAGQAPYMCLGSDAAPQVRCNGDLGTVGSSDSQPGGTAGYRVGQTGLRHYNLAENEDGSLRAVHFESRLPLVEDDHNGSRMDVYEWRNGALSLISPGNADHSAFYTGGSRDGESVFFWTEQRISPWEIDATDGDVYVARVGGGVPDPPSPPPVCNPLLSQCQSGSSQPISTPQATGTPTGEREAASDGRRTLKATGPSRRQRKRAARNGWVALSVSSNQAGQVTAVAQAAVKGRRQIVSRGSVRLRKAGTVSLRLRLSPRARRALKAGKDLRVQIVVKAADAHERTLTTRLMGAGR